MTSKGSGRAEPHSPRIDADEREFFMTTQAQSAFAKITLDLTPPVARLTLVNPPVNVIDFPMMDEFVAALEQIEQRPDILIIVLAGSERAFSVGVDVKAHTPDKVPVRAFATLSAVFTWAEWVRNQRDRFWGPSPKIVGTRFWRGC